jgi:pimeloyl-ACP methyl ester carboxylesterase
MTKPVLVLVHGRAQGKKTEGELRTEWIATLSKGLGPERAKRLDDVEIRLPFYGAQLDALVEATSVLPSDVATRGDPTGIDAEFIEFRREFAEEIRARQGISDDQIRNHMPGNTSDRGPLQWGWVHAIMRTLEDVPGLSGDMIERFTRDVWVYLTDDHVHNTINDIVARAMPMDGKAVVLGHSLGSVVAYDVLRKAGNGAVSLYLTVGSPLGVKSIKAKLAPIAFPRIVSHWFNAFDDRDAVALYPLTTNNFSVAPPIENFGEVKNGTSNAHGISGYLNNAVVAGRLFDALFA